MNEPERRQRADPKPIRSTIPSRQDERKYGTKPRRGAQSKSPAVLRRDELRAQRAAARRAKQ